MHPSSPEMRACWQGKNFLVAHPHTQDLPASGKLMQHALYNTCTALRGGVLLGHEQVRKTPDLEPDMGKTLSSCLLVIRHWIFRR